MNNTPGWCQSVHLGCPSDDCDMAVNKIKHAKMSKLSYLGCTQYLCDLYADNIQILQNTTYMSVSSNYVYMLTTLQTCILSWSPYV